MSSDSEITNHFSNNQRLRFARIVFALALLLGVMSCFLDWEIMQTDKFPGDNSYMIKNAMMMVRVVVYGIYVESQEFFKPFISISPWVMLALGHSRNLSTIW